MGFSLATSIDAFAVGVSLGLIGVSIWVPAAIIGFVTLLLSYLATHLGRRVGPYLGQWAERVGGLILIGLGLNILEIKEIRILNMLPALLIAAVGIASPAAQIGVGTG